LGLHLWPMQIPLWAYVLLSVMAIAAIASMVRRLRPGAPPVMAAENALHVFREDFPRVESASAEAAPDGKTFLILAPSGALVGCVTLIGLRWTARRIGARDVASASANGDRTAVTFHDFAWPSLRIDWCDEGAAQDWAARFNAMRRPDHA
jgi:hypothetical protein